jgi:hypothetical protein
MRPRFHHDDVIADGPRHYHPEPHEAEHVALVLTGLAIDADGLDERGHLRPATVADLCAALAMVVGEDMLPGLAATPYQTP